MKKKQTLLNIPQISWLFSASLKGKSLIVAILLGATLLSAAGCKKSKIDDPSYYGYGKLTVDCEKKCHVTFGEGDKLNDFDVDGTMATYVFRYQSKYDLDIKVTPVEEQNITLNVYSREERQIYHNTALRPAGTVWRSIILVP